MVLEDLGRRVRERRLSLGLKQEELAQLTHKTRGYISRLEAGQSGDSLRDLIIVARALGLRLADLAGETDAELLAEVRSRTPEGTEIAMLFQRLARGLPGQSESDRAFILASIEALVARWGREAETEAGR